MEIGAKYAPVASPGSYAYVAVPPSSSSSSTSYFVYFFGLLHILGTLCISTSYT